MPSISRLRRPLPVLVMAVAWTATWPAPEAVAQPIVTALTASGPFLGNAEESQTAFARVRSAGAGAMRIYLSWAGTAPRQRPGSWDPTNPDDPNYSWRFTDEPVQRAVAAGLTPIVLVNDAPAWAERYQIGPAGTNAPDADELGQFMLAAARRYNGTVAGIPAVRFWLIWNEPNASYFFNPQREGERDVSPGLYRDMVNKSAASVRSVSDANRVVAGATYPFAANRPDAQAIGARRFLKELLSAPVDFDIWSVHPYTSGNAFHKAFDPEGVSLGDLPAIRQILDSAAQSGKIGSRGPVQFWIDEFSWDSAPPDPSGVPTRLLTRWTSEAVYQAWKSGVSLFAWFQLRDDPMGAGFQSGLYFRCSGGVACDQPKPTLAAFRFPFVAYRQPAKRRSGSRRTLPGKVLVWGRTPAGARGTVTVEQRRGAGWRSVAKVKTDSGGIFSRRIRTNGNRAMRARTSAGDTAVAFSLRVPADRPETRPFGS